MKNKNLTKETQNIINIELDKAKKEANKDIYYHILSKEIFNKIEYNERRNNEDIHPITIVGRINAYLKKYCNEDYLIGANFNLTINGDFYDCYLIIKKIK